MCKLVHYKPGLVIKSRTISAMSGSIQVAMHRNSTHRYSTQTFVFDGEVDLTVVISISVSRRWRHVTKCHFEFVRLGRVDKTRARTMIRAHHQVLSGCVFAQDRVLATVACSDVVLSSWLTGPTSRRQIASLAAVSCGVSDNERRRPVVRSEVHQRDVDALAWLSDNQPRAWGRADTELLSGNAGQHSWRPMNFGKKDEMVTFRRWWRGYWMLNIASVTETTRSNARRHRRHYHCTVIHVSITRSILGELGGVLNAFLHFIHRNGVATPTSYIVIAILSLTLP